MTVDRRQMSDVERSQIMNHKLRYLFSHRRTIWNIRIKQKHKYHTEWAINCVILYSMKYCETLNINTNIAETWAAVFQDICLTNIFKIGTTKLIVRSNNLFYDGRKTIQVKMKLYFQNRKLFLNIFLNVNLIAICWTQHW